MLQVEAQSDAIHIEDVHGKTVVNTDATSCQVVDGALVLSSCGNVREVYAAGVWRRFWKASKARSPGTSNEPPQVPVPGVGVAA